MNQRNKEFKINAATLYLENKVIKTVMELARKVVI